MRLFDLIYAIVLLLLSPIIFIRSLFSQRFRSYLKSRFLVDFKPVPVSPEKKKIWLHAASVGEVNLALKVSGFFEKETNDLEFILTTNTQSALEMARNRGAKNVCLAPLDFSRLIRKFISTQQVQHLILIETELWPNMISQMSSIGTVSVINGRLSDKHFKTYRRLRFLFKSSVQKLSLILAGDPNSETRFKSLGADPSRVNFVGNLKFELPTAPKPELIEAVSSKYLLEKKDWIFVMGSIQPSEVEPLMKGVLKAEKTIGKLRLFMIPRHPNKKDEFKAALKKMRVPYYFSSDGPYEEKFKEEGRVIVVDEVGVLLAFYQIASLIFVGGSLCDRGGQNMLEAVALKKPVFIGPFATNFQQEVNILNQGKGIRIIKSPGEISEFLIRTLANKKLAESYAVNGYKTLVENSGGFDKTIQGLKNLLQIP
jgi:3-deoxy-D-manno-octulosonic-acid transferase